MAKQPPQATPATPEEFPQVEPQELFPSNNIRFVMWEVAKLTERVEALTKAIEKVGPAMEKAMDRHAADLKEKVGDLKSDLKETDTKVVAIEGKVNFVRGAMWVFGGLFTIAIVILGVWARGKVG